MCVNGDSRKNEGNRRRNTQKTQEINGNMERVQADDKESVAVRLLPHGGTLTRLMSGLIAISTCTCVLTNLFIDLID